MPLHMRQLLKLAAIALRCVPAYFRSRSKQAIVELALRQQGATFSEKRPRPRIAQADRGFWVLLSRVLVGMERSPGDLLARHRGLMASRGIQALLACDLEGRTLPTSDSS